MSVVHSLRLIRIPFSHTLLLAFVASTTLFGQVKNAIVDLRDFTETEVKGTGFVLNNDTAVRISALGGGDRVFWREMFDNADESRMYASGWIIDADSREVVWEMTIDNTSGRSYKRSFEGTVQLQRGAYEAYFAAYGFYHSSMFSSSSINIDRRPDHRRHRWSDGSFFGIVFGDGDDLYDEFMEYASTYGMTISLAAGDAGSVARFEVPREPERVLFRAAPLGDGAVVRKILSVSAPATLEVYALGEGRRKDDVYDHGWIVNSESRERVWEMNDRRVRYAGGASKNIKWVGSIELAKGNYELTYITDDSHSADDWNAKPPFDPLSYGITLSAKNDADMRFVRISDIPDITRNVIVDLTGALDNEFKHSGFTLRNETRLRVYAIGEQGNRGEMVDYGWIVNARTREKVWVMSARETFHAGGASKNRVADAVVTLPAGNYVAYYQTDDSHAFNEWNADPPFDAKRYGLIIIGAGERFDPRSVTPYAEKEDTNVLVQLIRVQSGQRMRERFSVEKSGQVRVYALGEGQDRRMYDYGWIEDARTGKVVWEMTYGMTERAGGARKNRLVNASVYLEKGDYELHYRTDDSHAFNDWNDDPPEDRAHWGITIYRQ